MIEIYLLTAFVLASFLGYEMITKVPPTLHTPLMSGTNAISGIIIIGALASLSYVNNPLASIIGILALIMATINVVGGFMVTNRMLRMFKK
ncbi:MAG: NAD(P) transhydrogenase subunit alpha [Candidatus Woesearchaeota archaeon]